MSLFFNTIFVSGHMYPENPERAQVNISDFWNLNMTNICHLTSIVDFENQGQTFFQTYISLAEYICYGLDISIEFNIIEVEKLKNEINTVAIMTDLENNINLKKRGLTLKIRANHQGQETKNGLSEILNLENVRIDTKIESIADIQPEKNKVI